MSNPQSPKKLGVAMRVKNKDIAKITNVSTATVSLALNDKPGVNRATRLKILRAAKMLSDNSRLHKDLDRLSEDYICFLKIVKHGHVLNRDHDVFIATYLEGLEDEAKLNGYKLEIGTLNSSDIAEAVGLLSDNKASGFIILGTELTASDVERLLRIGKPMVFMDTHYDFESAHFVDMDNTSDVFKVIQYLQDMGHREIGYLRSDAEVRNFILRDEGFEKAVNHLGITLHEKYIFTVDSTFDGAYRDMIRHLSRRRKLPTAFFAVNDITAYGCIKAFREKGYRIPQDISIIGFDDLPTSAIMDPPLSTLRVMNKQIGQTAMRLAMRRVREGDALPITKVTLGCELIIRKSVLWV